MLLTHVLQNIKRMSSNFIRYVNLLCVVHQHVNSWITLLVFSLKFSLLLINDMYNQNYKVKKISLSLNQVFQTDVKIDLYCIKAASCNQKWVWSMQRTLQIFLVIELGNLLAANSVWQYLGRVNVHLLLILHKYTLINCSMSFSFSSNA